MFANFIGKISCILYRNMFTYDEKAFGRKSDKLIKFDRISFPSRDSLSSII